MHRIHQNHIQQLPSIILRDDLLIPRKITLEYISVTCDIHKLKDISNIKNQRDWKDRLFF